MRYKLKRCGLRNGAKEFCLMMPWTCRAAGQERTKSKGKALADTWWAKGKADTWQTRFGGTASGDKGRTQGGHRPRHGGHIWRRGQSGLKVDKADTGRTRGGRAPGTRPEHIAASLFFPKREPHSKLFGEKRTLFRISAWQPWCFRHLAAPLHQGPTIGAWQICKLDTHIKESPEVTSNSSMPSPALGWNQISTVLNMVSKHASTFRDTTGCGPHRWWQHQCHSCMQGEISRYKGHTSVCSTRILNNNHSKTWSLTMYVVFGKTTFVVALDPWIPNTLPLRHFDIQNSKTH